MAWHGRRSLRVPDWVVEADATALAEREVTYSEATLSALHSYIHSTTTTTATSSSRSEEAGTMQRRNVKQQQIMTVQEMQQLVSQVRQTTSYLHLQSWS